MNKVIMIQARMSSLRFPNKMLQKISGISLIEYVYNRCNCSKVANGVIVLTSTEKSDDILFEECRKKSIPVYRGSLNNVLQRYIDASEYIGAEIICRVCGDSPFVDVESIDKMFNIMMDNINLEYITKNGHYNGFKSEIFNLSALKKTNQNRLTNEQKEHVTLFLLENEKSFNTEIINKNIECKNQDGITLTVDYPEDIIDVDMVANSVDGFCATTKDIVNILNKK